MRRSRCGNFAATAVANWIKRADPITRAPPRANNKVGKDHAYRNGAAQRLDPQDRCDVPFVTRYRNRKPPSCHPRRGANTRIDTTRTTLSGGLLGQLQVSQSFMLHQWLRPRLGDEAPKIAAVIKTQCHATNRVPNCHQRSEFKNDNQTMRTKRGKREAIIEVIRKTNENMNKVIATTNPKRTRWRYRHHPEGERPIIVCRNDLQIGRPSFC
jgi:hypothetical protein